MLKPSLHEKPLSLKTGAVMAFDAEAFAHTLLSEVLFFDAEYHVIGSVSLIDADAQRERFIAAFDPDEEVFLIEEATDWEEEDDDDLGYRLAADGTIHRRYATSAETATALLALADLHNLQPVFLPLFEEE